MPFSLSRTISTARFLSRKSQDEQSENRDRGDIEWLADRVKLGDLLAIGAARLHSFTYTTARYVRPQPSCGLGLRGEWASGDHRHRVGRVNRNSRSDFTTPVEF